MQNQSAISMSLHPFVAVVARTQFPADAMAKLAAAGAVESSSAEEQQVINRLPL
ncbi:hypothetical protein [Caballeronia sordidicola]|uniref:hypothetical protein n=1 Tax=Caballeronia sordidicola TaxID=196367 RepID=UPI0013636A1E|nr:hypothetical protein [Caballeronia sordidicola]